MLKQLTVFMVLFAITFNVHATECGKVTIADMNWDSATFVANVDSFILQHGFGCEIRASAERNDPCCEIYSNPR